MKSFQARRTRPALAVALLCGFLVVGPAALAGEWKWELTPYLWGSDVSLDATVNDSLVASTTVDVSDLVDKLDIGGLIHFEGHRGRAGFFLEANYYEFSDDKTILNFPPITDGTVVHSELDLLIGEAGGLYKIVGEDGRLDVLFGVRVFDTGLDLDFDSDPMLGRDETILDGFVGLRHRSELSERWTWWGRIDAGTGDTELSWQAILGVGFKLGRSKQNALVLAYRHLAFEFEGGSTGIIGVDLELSGPLLGFRFGF